MQYGVVPQAKRMCTGVHMLMYRSGIVVIKMQSLVIMVVVTIALGMDRHVVELVCPMGSNPGGEQRGRLPDNSQHQQKCANRAGHERSV